VNQTEIQSLSLLARELNNPKLELILSATSFSENQLITTFYNELIFFDDAISFLAIRFVMFSLTRIERLSVESLEYILSNPLLRIRTEDDLLHNIVSLDREYWRFG
jgi:hypothetical protein